MSKDTVTIYKWFWADQDAEQEQWLRERARAGLHLVGINPFCGWTFQRGAASDMVYRVDYHNSWDAAAYRQLFQDAGWELAASIVGWQYWRKRAGDGPAPEIFTDISSRMVMYKQVLLLVAVCTLPLMMMLLRPQGMAALGTFSTPALVVILVATFVALPVNAYGAWRLMRRLRQLRQASA